MMDNSLTPIDIHIEISIYLFRVPPKLPLLKKHIIAHNFKGYKSTWRNFVIMKEKYSGFKKSYNMNFKCLEIKPF